MLEPLEGPHMKRAFYVILPSHPYMLLLVRALKTEGFKIRLVIN